MIVSGILYKPFIALFGKEETVNSYSTYSNIPVRFHVPQNEQNLPDVERGITHISSSKRLNPISSSSLSDSNTSSCLYSSSIAFTKMKSKF